MTASRSLLLAAAASALLAQGLCGQEPRVPGFRLEKDGLLVSSKVVAGEPLTVGVQARFEVRIRNVLDRGLVLPLCFDPYKRALEREKKMFRAEGEDLVEFQLDFVNELFYQRDPPGSKHYWHMGIGGISEPYLRRDLWRLEAGAELAIIVEITPRLSGSAQFLFSYEVHNRHVGDFVRDGKEIRWVEVRVIEDLWPGTSFYVKLPVHVRMPAEDQIRDKVSALRTRLEILKPDREKGAAIEALRVDEVNLVVLLRLLDIEKPTEALRVAALGKVKQMVLAGMAFNRVQEVLRGYSASDPPAAKSAFLDVCEHLLKQKTYSFSFPFHFSDMSGTAFLDEPARTRAKEIVLLACEDPSEEIRKRAAEVKSKIVE